MTRLCIALPTAQQASHPHGRPGVHWLTNCLTHNPGLMLSARHIDMPLVLCSTVHSRRWCLFPVAAQRKRQAMLPQGKLCFLGSSGDRERGCGSAIVFATSRLAALAQRVCCNSLSSTNSRCQWHSWASCKVACQSRLFVVVLMLCCTEDANEARGRSRLQLASASCAGQQQRKSRHFIDRLRPFHFAQGVCIRVMLSTTIEPEGVG